MLTLKEQRQLKRYEDDLAMRRWKYILIYGVIWWGIVTPVLITLFELIIEGKSLQQKWNEPLWTRFLIFPFMGIFMGLFMRWMITKQKTKLRKKKNRLIKKPFLQIRGRYHTLIFFAVPSVAVCCNPVIYNMIKLLD